MVGEVSRQEAKGEAERIFREITQQPHDVVVQVVRKRTIGGKVKAKRLATTKIVARPGRDYIPR